MKLTETVAYGLFAVSFLFPAVTKAQGLGQIVCAKADDSVYLYSSVSTMEVRATLKCGEEVQVLNRYDNFLYVRTEKGVVGYVPLEAISRTSGKRGTKSPSTTTAKKAGSSAP